MRYRIKYSFWKSKLELLRNEEVIGHVEKANFWGRRLKGFLLGKEYIFDYNGTFYTSTTILDDKQQIIGEVSYNYWTSKARIEYNDKRYIWESANFWGTHWKLTDELGREIGLQKNEFHINYSSADVDEFVFLLVAFLYYHYYNQRLAAAAV